MSIVSDFDDIARRMNRKPEAMPGIVPLATPFAVSIGRVPRTQMPAGADQTDWLKLDAAVKTLQSLGYTYTDGAEMWKPPLGNGSAIPSWPIVDANYNNALFGSLKAKSGVSSAEVVKAWKQQMGHQMMIADIASGRIKSING